MLTKELKEVEEEEAEQQMINGELHYKEEPSDAC